MLYSVDAIDVAKHRVDYYYQSVEDDEDFDYQSELDYVLQDKYELRDWLLNNTNPTDFDYKEIGRISSEKLTSWNQTKSISFKYE